MFEKFFGESPEQAKPKNEYEGKRAFPENYKPSAEQVSILLKLGAEATEKGEN